MRTDSNTVLSLPSGVPPKKSALTKASTNNGTTFANDFNRAKETLAPKKAPATDKVAAPSSSVSSSANSSSATTKVLDKNAASTNSKDKVSTSSADSSAVVAVTAQAVSQDSGKALQQDGEVSPADGLLVAVSTEDSELPVTAAPSGLQSAEINSPLISDFDGVPQERIEQNPLVDNAVVGGVGLVSVAPTVTEEASKDVIVTGQVSSAPIVAEEASKDAIASGLSSGVGVVGLDAIRRTVATEAQNTNPTLSKTTVSEDTVEPAIIDDKGELSWVLSQMGGGEKKASVTPIGDAGLDTTKAAASVVAGAIASSVMNKENRTGSSPSPLVSEGGIAAASDETSLDSSDSLLDMDGLLVNEPVELRKKEQETMLGRMSAQIDGKQNDDASPGGLNSSLHNNSSRAGVGAVALNASMSNPQANNLAMSLPPSHPGWANEMSQKVAWIARDGGHTAHIRLDPPELGSLTVKVSVDSDSNTQISFVAATPHARDLLEGQMGRLREMLAQQGMDLSRADVDVSQQDTSGAQDRANNRNNGSSQSGVASSDEVDEELIAKNLSYVSASGVDYYA